MSALPGEHYCKDHQGYLGQYDPKNCTVCRLQGEISRLQGEINRFQAGNGEPVGGDVKTEFNRYKRAVITGAQRDKVDVDTRFNFADFHAGYRAGRWSPNHPTNHRAEQYQSRDKLYTHPPAKVPEGYVIAPISPTRSMCEAGCCVPNRSGQSEADWVQEIYLAMLDAAPTPATTPQPADSCEHGIRHPHPCRECEDREPPVEQETDAESYKFTLKRAIAMFEDECEKCGPDRIGDAVWFETDIDRLKELLEKVHLLVK